jgi:hypothetical protein
VDPSLPIYPAEASNGEFVPRAPTAHERAMAHEICARIDHSAQRLHVDRRALLHRASGVAATLAVFNLFGCSSSDSLDGRTPTGSSTSSSVPGTATSSTSPTTTSGGVFEVPDPADVAACDEMLSGAEFIFDVHSHHVMPDGPWRENAPSIVSMIRPLVPDDCTSADPFEGLDRVSYLQDFFLASDTTIAMLSDVPNSGPDDAPIPWLEALRTKQLADTSMRGGASRVLLHNVIAPNFGDLSARLDGMSQTAATRKVAAFKVYTAWGPGNQGFAMDDPKIGLPVLDHARQLGIKILCAHKGLPIQGFDQRFNGPADIVAVAKQYPDMQFVVYHSAFERETVEGAYSPTAATRGVSSLVKAVIDNGLPPNSNVWAELGTTWRELMRKPNEAAHCIGKLLTHIGEDRVLWGTDSIWYGSPQPQIMAFRAFQITAEFQERFGYPALTDARKQKIFGLNAAKLDGVQVDAARCALQADKLEASKLEFASFVSSGRITTPWQPRGPMSRRDVLAFLRVGGRIGAG